jgi:5-methylcytosine-specific restriction endonuclease McrA
VRDILAPDDVTRAYATALRRDPCSYCGGRMEDVDHIDAIARGGLNHWTNLTAACGTCNNRKYALSLLTFLSR